MANKVSILEHKGGLESFITFWSNKEVECLARGGERAELIRKVIEDSTRRIAEGESEENIKAYGLPYPSSVSEAMSRRTFLNWELYNNAYLELLPYLQKLDKLSTGIIPKDVITPTDRDAGVFSFERAMMALQPTPAFYNEKDKKFYPIDSAYRKKNASGKDEYFLKANNEKVIIKQLEVDGQKKFSSENRKSFIYKQQFPRPKNAIRLFCQIGANWGSVTYWAGIATVIAAQFLESKGYSVRITCAVGVGLGSEAQFGAERLRNCARFDLFDLKGYSEQMNSLAVLYPLADPSFFRVRCFQQLATQQYVYNDGRDTGLGHYASREDLKQGISESQKRKTMDVEKDVLYYFIGGEMHRGTEQTIDDAKYFLQNIVCNAEHENVALLARMQGIELPPREPNPNPSPDDAHCQELEEQFNKA